MRDLEKETEITFFRGSGPGGQLRNKVETGVRLVHRPTGTVVEVDEERSQARNRAIAFARLAERLEELRRPKRPRRQTKVPRREREERREEKKRRGKQKSLRRKIGEE